MRAQVLDRAAPFESSPWRPLRLDDVPAPTPGADDLLVRVNVCAVCRTDLDIAEGRLVPPRYPVVPGHQVVGRVAAVGANVRAFSEGDRVGVAWIHWADGVCEWCRKGLENLCPRFQATGCDVQGGYADLMTVPAAFAHVIPSGIDDVAASPLLCAGAIGWRSLRLTNLSDGEPLGLTGFGASGHLVLQLARRRFPRSPVFVFARAESERAFAMTLGAAWAGDTGDAPPEQLSAIIDTTPAWKPVIAALRVLRPGGRVVINAIRKETRDQSELLSLDYGRDLWKEREIKSVANVTRADVRETLDAASQGDIHATVEELPLERANEALEQQRGSGGIRGSRVLRVTA
ncbi:MAG: zinc-dependent alcohol dehydrogenase family protein [Gemmatimonadaceae bacterium]